MEFSLILQREGTDRRQPERWEKETQEDRWRWRREGTMGMGREADEGESLTPGMGTNRQKGELEEGRERERVKEVWSTQRERGPLRKHRKYKYVNGFVKKKKREEWQSFPKF